MVRRKTRCDWSKFMNAIFDHRPAATRIGTAICTRFLRYLQLTLVGSTCGLNDVNQETLPRLPPVSDLEDDILDVEDDVLEYAERTRSSRMRTIETCQSVASSKSTYSLTRTAKTWTSKRRTSREGHRCRGPRGQCLRGQRTGFSKS